MAEPEVTAFMAAPLRVLDWLSRVANLLGSLLIFALVVLITADVIMKNVFLQPTPGTIEMVTLSIVAIVFLQAPQALREGRFTRSDGLINSLHRRLPRLAASLETTFDLVGAAVLSAVIYAHLPILARAWTRNEYIGSVGNFMAPTWPVKAMLALGALLLLLQFLARVIRRHGGSSVSR